MKKIVVALLFCVFFLFGGKKEIKACTVSDIFIMDGNVVIVADCKNDNFPLAEAEFALLMNEGEKTGYRATLINNCGIVKLCFDNILGENKIVGFYEDLDILINLIPSSIFACGFVELCEQNIILNDSEKYNVLNSYFLDYLRLEREMRLISKPEVNGFDALNSSDLEEATSTDEYLNNYSPDIIPSYIYKTDDPIVRIVPKSYFFSEGTHTYLGKEYMFYIDTFRIQTSFESFYLSHVFVLDIDFTRPNTSARDLIKTNVMGACADKSSYLYMESVINNYYCGIEHYSSIFYDQYMIDDTQYQVVLNNRNMNIFMIANMEPTPIYADAKNLAYRITRENSDSAKMCLQSVRYYVDTNDINVSATSETSEYISSVAWDLLLTALEYKFGPIVTAVDIGLSIVYAFEDIVLDDANMDKQCYSGDLNNPFQHNFDSEDFRPTAYVVKMASFLDKLVAIGNDDYEIQIETKFDSDILTEKESYKLLHQIDLTLTFQLFDYDGNVINVNNNEYYVYNYSSNHNTHGKRSVDNYVQNMSFDIDQVNVEDVIAYKPLQTKMYHFIIPSNFYVRVCSVDGREIVSSNNSRFSGRKIMSVYLDSKQVYFVAGGYLNGAVGHVNLVEYFSKPTSNEWNDYERFDSERIFYFNVSSEYSIYNISTDSMEDTIIIVLDEFGRTIAFDDDSNADWSEDEPDLNANLNVGLTKGKYFVLVYVDYAYQSGSYQLMISN